MEASAHSNKSTISLFREGGEQGRSWAQKNTALNPKQTRYVHMLDSSCLARNRGHVVTWSSVQLHLFLSSQAEHLVECNHHHVAFPVQPYSPVQASAYNNFKCFYISVQLSGKLYSCFFLEPCNSASLPIGPSAVSLAGCINDVHARTLWKVTFLWIKMCQGLKMQQVIFW